MQIPTLYIIYKCLNKKKYFVWTYLPAMLIAHLLKLSILCNAQISILEYSKKKKNQLLALTLALKILITQLEVLKYEHCVPKLLNLSIAC